MAVFEFTAPGVPADAAEARANRPHYSATADGRIYRPQLQVLIAAVRPTRPGVVAWANAQIDTGADCSMFKEAFAFRLGLSRPANALRKSFRTAAGPATAWFAEVRMHLGFPSDSDQFDWTTQVGFLPDAALPDAYQGVFGVGGGLEVFDHIDMVLSPTGRGMPVTRVWVHD